MRTFSKFHRWIRLRKNVFLRSDWAGRCLICWWAVELCVGPNFWQTVRPCIFRVGTVLCPMCFWERSIVFARGWLICFCIANILAWLHHWCRLPWHFVGTESSWLGDQSRSWIVQWFYTIECSDELTRDQTREGDRLVPRHNQTTPTGPRQSMWT